MIHTHLETSVPSWQSTANADHEIDDEEQDTRNESRRPCLLPPELSLDGVALFPKGEGGGIELTRFIDEEVDAFATF